MNMNESKMEYECPVLLEFQFSAVSVAAGYSNQMETDEEHQKYVINE